MFTHIDLPPVDITLTRKTVLGKRFYTIKETGEKFPSVTTVLSSIPHPKLIAWEQRLGAQKAKKEKERCAMRGTAVHLLAEQYLKNNPNPTHENLLYQKLFNKLKLWLKKINNIKAQEIPLVSRTLKIAGTADCIAEYEGKLSVIDFKTANHKKDTDTIEDYFLQCTAYALCFDEMYDIFIDDIVILISSEKGATPLVFKRKIDDYVKPLVERINTFYKRK